MFQIQNAIYDSDQPSTKQALGLLEYVDTYADVLLDFKNKPIITEQLEKNRQLFYHNLNHMFHVVNVVNGIFGNRKEYWNHDTRALALGLFFHDIIYVPGATDNEERSAKFLHDVAYDPEEDTVVLAKQVILATKHEAVASDEVCRLACDIDLIGLAAHPVVFNANSEAIRKEFRVLPDSVYIPGRIAFMSKLLQRDKIYVSQRFTSQFAGFETIARNNISNHINDLKKSLDNL
jgi:predicted metal-dependent HD superfamily phosphohydrolase